MAVQGDCKEPPPLSADLELEGPPLLWAAPQCVLVFDHNIFTVADALWLDALALRARRSAWPAFFFLIIAEDADAAALYATRVTFQGNQHVNSTAVFTYSAADDDTASTVFLQGMIHDAFIRLASRRSHRRSVLCYTWTAHVQSPVRQDLRPSVARAACIRSGCAQYAWCVGC